MRYTYSPLRPGMTALAAALALTSTPLVAQDATIAPAEPATPVIIAPPPAPVPAEPVTAAPAAQASGLNIPQISVNLDDSPKQTSSDSTAGGTARTSEAQSEPRPVKRTAASAPQPAPPAAAVKDIAVAPEPAATLPPPVTAMTPPSSETVPAPAATTQATSENADDVLPIAGGILGALALMGGAFAFVSRRRRHRDTDIARVEEPFPLTVPLANEPVFNRGTVVSPTPVMEQSTAKLPSGFDLSRYGPHVQAAYRGPTADNPSLSLSKRLKRARFYDQRARMAANGAAAPASTQTVQPATAPMPERTMEYVTSRRSGGGNVGFRPAFQN